MLKYPDFMEAVEICMNAGQACYCAKSDMSMAFRNIPMDKKSWCYLILKAYHPITGEVFYFADKCLPFGASISCAIFQEFSDSIAFLVRHRTHRPLVNYLDDFFFAAMCKAICTGVLGYLQEDMFSCFTRENLLGNTTSYIPRYVN